MILEHIAIWTNKLELLKEFYVTHFDGTSNEKYTNSDTGFSSYFISFTSGARLEIMTMPGIPDNLNDKVISQHQGLIHLAFGVESMQEVDGKAKQLKDAGYRILSGPRKTGDGYYEFETLDPDNNRLEVTTEFGH
jgi:lactoylglutathione lyase